MLLHQTLLVVVNRPDVVHVRSLHLSAAASLGDGLQGVGALRAEGGRGSQVLWDAGAGGEGGVGRVAFAVEVVDAVGGPGMQSCFFLGGHKPNQYTDFCPSLHV